jgi:hypothetical protein
MRARVLLALVLAAGCGKNLGPSPDDRRGDTNGRMFDFVSSKPDGGEWTIRVRGDSMWLAYAEEDESKDLGPVTLSAKESRKLWRLVDEVAVDEDEEVDPEADDIGTVLLRIREPSADGEHDIISIYLPRDTENDSVIDLASYLIDLVKAHHDVEPAF